MRMRWTLAILCFALGTSVAAQSQTKKRPLTTVPSVLNSPPDANPQCFPKGIFRDSSDRGNFKDFDARWYSTYLRATECFRVRDFGARHGTRVAMLVMSLETSAQ